MCAMQQQNILTCPRKSLHKIIDKYLVKALTLKKNTKYFRREMQQENILTGSRKILRKCISSLQNTACYQVTQIRLVWCTTLKLFSVGLRFTRYNTTTEDQTVQFQIAKNNLIYFDMMVFDMMRFCTVFSGMKYFNPLLHFHAVHVYKVKTGRKCLLVISITDFPCKLFCFRQSSQAFSTSLLHFLPRGPYYQKLLSAFRWAIQKWATNESTNVQTVVSCMASGFQMSETFCCVLLLFLVVLAATSSAAAAVAFSRLLLNATFML